MNQKNFLIAQVPFCKVVLYFFLLTFLFTQLCACGNDKEKPATQPAVENALDSELEDWAAIKLPDITKQPITLRVANVVNPRFKQLSENQLQRILKRSQQLVKQYFDVAINFSEIKTQKIADVFNKLKPEVVSQRKSEIVDIGFIDKEDREEVQVTIYKTLANYSQDEKKVIDYAQPYLLHPEIKQTDFIGLSYALVDTLIARLNYWKKQKATDGHPVLDSNGYNEWVWWDSLGYGDLPYEVVITNQLVASAEYYGMDVHSSICGGLTAGTTTYNRNALLSTYVYVMVYPMLNDTDLLNTLRQDSSYSDEQIVNYSAALLTHELGHMLLRLGHPFGDKHCIMSPTTLLNYRDWYNHLDGDQCGIGSSEQMTPGVARIDYNKKW